jgi:endonuclease G
MILKKLLCYVGLVLATTACSRNTVPTMPLVSIPHPSTYSITEDFEEGAKSDYAAADVQFATGSWNLDQAVVGHLPSDQKNGNKSIRMKSGALRMNFDISGVNTVYIKHAKYGNDPMSTWTLLYSTDGGLTFTQLGEEIQETNTILVVDSFKVDATSQIRFEIQNTGSTTKARINLDDITFKGSGDPGISAGVADTVDISDVTVDTTSDTTMVGIPEASRRTVNIPGTRGLEVGPDAEPETGDDSNMLFGNPSNASSTTPDNFYMDQKYYVESYSSSRSIPNWVSWHLDADNTSHTAPRQNNFAGFNGLPEDFYIVKSNSYNGSGFDRGHNCPSADRNSSSAANSATFLMTNMVPQAPHNNEQTWAHFEEYLRTQVDAGNEVYVIMGSYGIGGSGSKGRATTIDKGRITVPAYVWKVALIIPDGSSDVSRVSSSTRVIAINTPNNNTIDPDWRKYIVTVRAIEAATGYDLLSALPENIQNQIELKKDAGK